METFLYIVFFLSCLVLIIAVLLQPGKTDAGALFTSGVSSAAMNPRGTASVLSKLTIAAATIFMISALMLSLPALTGNRSVLDTQGTDSETPTTNTNTANTNANSQANTANTSTTNTSSNAEVKKVDGSKANTAKDDAGNKAKTEEKKEESK